MPEDPNSIAAIIFATFSGVGMLLFALNMIGLIGNNKKVISNGSPSATVITANVNQKIDSVITSLQHGFEQLDDLVKEHPEMKKKLETVYMQLYKNTPEESAKLLYEIRSTQKRTVAAQEENTIAITTQVKAVDSLVTSVDTLVKHLNDT